MKSLTKSFMAVVIIALAFTVYSLAWEISHLQAEMVYNDNSEGEVIVSCYLGGDEDNPQTWEFQYGIEAQAVTIDPTGLVMFRDLDGALYMCDRFIIIGRGTFWRDVPQQEPALEFDESA